MQGISGDTGVLATREDYLGGDAIAASRTATRWRGVVALAAIIGVVLGLVSGSAAAVEFVEVGCWIFFAVAALATLVWSRRAGRYAAEHIQAGFGVDVGKLWGLPRDVAGCENLIRRSEKWAAEGQRPRFSVSVGNKPPRSR